MDTEPVWKKLEPNWPIIAIALASFLCGKFGLPILYIPILLYFVIHLEKTWRENAVKRELKQRLVEEDLRRVFLNEATESVTWLNRILNAMWPHLDRWLSATTTSFLIRTFVSFNQPDETGKSKSVQLDVKYVSFGTIPFKFEGVTAKAPATPYTARLDFNFTYFGDMRVELEATLPFMKVPLILSDIEIRGLLKTEMAFKERGNLKLLSISFMTPPTISFSVKTMGKLDIMDLPTLKGTINSLITEQLRRSMTYPNALTFDWSGTSAPSTTNMSSMTAEEREALQRKMIYETVSALDETEIPAAATAIPQNDAQIAQEATASSSASKTSSAVKPSERVGSDTAGTQSPRSSSNSTTPARSSLPTTPKTHTETASSSQDLTGGKLAAENQKRSTTGSSPKTPNTIATKPMQAFSKPKEDVNEFLLMSPEEFAGTMSIRVVECSKLAGGDLFSVDPYVVLEANGMKHQTTVVKHTTSPFWSNALFEFPVPKYLPQKGFVLKVHVYDKAKLGDDRSLGYANVNMNALLKKPEELHDFHVPLAGTVSGSVRLQSRYILEG